MSKEWQILERLRASLRFARAFAGDPRIVVADEPTSALDVSVQAADQLNLLSELQAKGRTSYLLISHDLGVIRYLADRIAVLYLGRIMEVGVRGRLPRPQPSVHGGPSVGGAERRWGGTPRILRRDPEPRQPTVGCVFNTRCPRVIRGLCEVTEPPLIEVDPGHMMSCHIPLEELRRLQRRSTDATRQC